MAFQPSNAGAQLVQTSLGISEGFQNMYVRAEALKQSQERFEQEKQLYAGQQTLQSLDIRRSENALKSQNVQSDIDSAKLDADRLDLDAKRRQATAEIAENSAFEQQLAAFPELAKGYTAIPGNDVRGLSAALSQIQSSFGGYANNQKFGARVAQVVAPMKQALADRLIMAQGLIEHDANEHLFDINNALASDDTASLEKLLKDPEVRKAALSPGEKGKALSETITKAVTELVSRQTKLKEKDAEFSGKNAMETQKETAKAAAKAAEEKSTRSVPGFSGLGRSAEQAGKFAESFGSYKSSTDSLEQLIEISKDATVFDRLAPTELAAKATALATLITAENKTKIVGPGAVSESEWEILHKLVANPTTLKNTAFRNQALASLNTLKSVLEKKIRNEAEVNGYTPDEGNPLFQGPKSQVPKVGDPFKATIGGKEVAGKWYEQNGQQGLLTDDGLFYPKNP